MGGGRKNLLRAKQELDVALQDGQSIMKVVSLRGSNLIEVMDAHGNYVVVDESGKEKALESGSKVACIVTQVLYHEQVRVLQKSPQWPAIFKSGATDDSNEKLPGNTSQPEIERDSSDGDDDDDDGLPPLEANTNRLRPFELQMEEDSESDSDTDEII